MANQFQYKLNKVSINEVSDEIERIWNGLQTPNSSHREQALEAGITEAELDSLTGVSVKDAIVVEPEGAGLDPFTTAIIVAILSTATEKTVEFIWDNIILPKLKKKFSDSSITPL